MSFEEFRESLKDISPPTGLSPALLALWHDARGEWEHAHRIAQDDPSSAGSWIHAYLHRKEGDPGNAGYWYRRCGRTAPPEGTPLETEWERIARTLCAGGM